MTIDIGLFFFFFFFLGNLTKKNYSEIYPTIIINDEDIVCAEVDKFVMWNNLFGNLINNI